VKTKRRKIKVVEKGKAKAGGEKSLYRVIGLGSEMFQLRKKEKKA